MAPDIIPLGRIVHKGVAGEVRLESYRDINFSVYRIKVSGTETRFDSMDLSVAKKAFESYVDKITTPPKPEFAELKQLAVIRQAVADLALMPTCSTLGAELKQILATCAVIETQLVVPEENFSNPA